MHQGAEVFEPQTELIYGWLQIITGCCIAFIHGAQDSANAAGPFASIWYCFQVRVERIRASLQPWMRPSPRPLSESVNEPAGHNAVSAMDPCLGSSRDLGRIKYIWLCHREGTRGQASKNVAIPVSFDGSIHGVAHDFPAATGWEYAWCHISLNPDLPQCILC